LAISSGSTMPQVPVGAITPRVSAVSSMKDK